MVNSAQSIGHKENTPLSEKNTPSSEESFVIMVPESKLHVRSRIRSGWFKYPGHLPKKTTIRNGKNVVFCEVSQSEDDKNELCFTPLLDGAKLRELRIAKQNEFSKNRFHFQRPRNIAPSDRTNSNDDGGYTGTLVIHKVTCQPSIRLTDLSDEEDETGSVIYHPEEEDDTGSVICHDDESDVEITESPSSVSAQTPSEELSTPEEFVLIERLAEEALVPESSAEKPVEIKSRVQDLSNHRSSENLNRTQKKVSGIFSRIFGRISAKLQWAWKAVVGTVKPIFSKLFCMKRS